ncbi:UDP-sugar transporter UST74c-like isoform X2 [Aethina tumida]|nr:UDP-sugar transporter UST74c-like isoform X2 [Aethina tumida]
MWLLNKYLLTHCNLPVGILVLVQVCLNVFVLLLTRTFGYTSFPLVNISGLYSFYPLPVIFGAKLAFHLLACHLIDLPTFLVLDRITIVVNTLADTLFFSNKVSKRNKTACYALILGACFFIDSRSNTVGYFCIVWYYIFDAATGVYSVKVYDVWLLGKHGIAFYCSLVLIPVMLVFNCLNGNFTLMLNKSEWLTLQFQAMVCVTSLLFTVQPFGGVLCTYYNRTRFTSTIGCARSLISILAAIAYLSSDTLNPSQWFGMIVSSGGYCFYSWNQWRASGYLVILHSVYDRTD